MRGSTARAAASPRRANSILSSGERSWPVGSSRSRAGTALASSDASGKPPSSSGAVMRASDTASSTSRSTEAREKSDVDAAAADLPEKTRSERCCSRACLTVSTRPSLTWAEKALSSTRKASAAVAPRSFARLRTSPRRSSILHLGPTDGHPVYPYGRQPDPDGYRLPILAAGTDTLVHLEVMAYATHARERIRAVADEGGALDRPGDLAVLDQVGLARRENELAAGDVHLPAPEVDGVEAAGHRAEDLLRIVLPRQHEGVGHARHGRMRIGLAAAITGGLPAHQPRVEPVLHITHEHAVLDEDVAPRGNTLVVHVEGAAPVGDGAVVDHRHELGGDLLPHAPGEGRGLLAVEVSLEPVAHRLVEEDARPAGTQYHRHLPRRRLHGMELHRGLPHRLGCESPPAFAFEEKLQGHAPAASVRADLALTVLLDDDGHVESGQRTLVADRPARGGGDQDDHVLAREARDHLLDARIHGARRRVHLAQQRELAIERGGDRRLGERVEIVGTSGTHGDHRRCSRLIGDGPGLPRRFFQIRQRQIIGMGVAGALTRLGANARPLAHVARSFLDRTFLERQLFTDPVLEIEVRMIHATRQVRSEKPLERGRRKTEPVLEEPFRPSEHVIF